MNKKYPDDFMQFVMKNYRPLDEAVKWLKKETQLKWTKEALLQGLEKVAAKPLHPSKILIAYVNNANIERGYGTEPVGLARLDRTEIENLLISGLVVTKKVMYSGISYIELAVDDTAHSHESFLIYSKYTRYSSARINEDKTVGTTYLGNRKSPKLIRKYDKKKQLLETDSVFSAPHPILTRIEASLRHPRLSPADLLELTNPFKNVYVVDMDTARAFSKSPVWQQFLDRCPSKGVPRAYPIKLALRKLCRKQLDGLHAPWWDSSDIWKSYPQALQVLIPTPHADGFKPKKVTELAQA